MATLRWSSADATHASRTSSLSLELSGAHGLSLLVIDAPDPALSLSSFLGRGVVIAVVDGNHREADLVVTSDEVPTLIASVEAHPQASAVAVQQLRLAELLPPLDGLVSESLAYATLQAGPDHAAWVAANGERRRVRPTFDEPAVQVVDHGERIDLHLNRPRLKNPLTTEMRNSLIELLRSVRHRTDLHAIDISGYVSAFCIGGDLAEFGSVDDPVRAHEIRLSASVARELVDYPIPVTMRVHGACVGAGVELAAFGSRVVAAPDATFSLPEVAMGVIPGAGGTVSLTQRLGRQAAARLVLMGTQIDADEALEIGLVDEIA